MSLRSGRILKAIAYNFFELNSEINPFLLARSWLEIDSLAHAPIH
ncbi:hypothetical protein [Pseudanabaena sp. BC1403]|nr:hypothetical protein [Pseudanabaena sp. BC1403]